MPIAVARSAAARRSAAATIRCRSSFARVIATYSRRRSSSISSLLPVAMSDGNAAVDDVEHMHGLPLLPLGGVDRRQDQVVVVAPAARRPRRWSHPADRASSRSGTARATDTSTRSAAAATRSPWRTMRIVVDALEMRLVPADDRIDVRGPIRRSAAEARANSATKRAPIRRERAGGTNASNAAAGPAPATSRRAIASPWPGRRPAAAAAREIPPSGCAGCRPTAARASTSLTCAASRNLRPPYFTNGMPRRASSSSSCALWLALRNSTACDLSAIPLSRCSSTRSRDVTRLVGFVAHRDEPRPLGRMRGRSRDSW